jgi:hypothetical protein
MHVTGNDQAGLTMNITIWQYTPSDIGETNPEEATARCA